MKYLAIFLLLILSPLIIHAYEIKVDNVVIYNEYHVRVSADVYLLTSGVTMYSETVTVVIGKSDPAWKDVLMDRLKFKVLEVNIIQMAEDKWQSGVSKFGTWLKNQVE